MKVRAVERGDAAAWLEMRLALWPEGPEAEHRDEIVRFFAGTLVAEPSAVLIAEDSGGAAIGFVELSLRPCAEGCATSPVAYLEGWYVRPEARRRGVGRALILAAEGWGRSQACVEFASDTQPDNRISGAAHLALGFEDAGLVRCFRKRIA